MGFSSSMTNIFLFSMLFPRVDVLNLSESPDFRAKGPLKAWDSLYRISITRISLKCKESVSKISSAPCLPGTACRGERGSGGRNAGETLTAVNRVFIMNLTRRQPSRRWPNEFLRTGKSKEVDSQNIPVRPSGDHPDLRKKTHRKKRADQAVPEGVADQERLFWMQTDHRTE